RIYEFFRLQFNYGLYFEARKSRNLKLGRKLKLALYSIFLIEKVKLEYSSKLDIENIFLVLKLRNK
ncbi:unnamed protein product, partial [Larinioides sclopetarius]